MKHKQNEPSTLEEQIKEVEAQRLCAYRKGDGFVPGNVCKFYQWLAKYGFEWHPVYYYEVTGKMEQLRSRAVFLLRSKASTSDMTYCFFFILDGDKLDKVKVFDVDTGRKVLEMYDLVDLFRFLDNQHI